MNTITNLTQKPIVVKMINIARVVFFVLGVITCFSTNKLFNSCNNPNVSIATSTVTLPYVYDMKLEVKKAVAYDQSIKVLQTKNEELQQQVSSTKTALVHSHNDNAALVTALKEHINTASQLTDTAEIISNCDSIAQTATAFLHSSEEKDSLYQTLTGVLEQQVINRDSVIAEHIQRNNYLQVNYDRSLMQQQILISDNLILHKQIKKARVKNRLLTAGLLILGGTATSLLLHH